ncbi:MAG: transcription-repair coupling factor [Ignavibacteria bacterium]|nr:transcription-repair coupling factor [Ignavibacteria bacterium]
MNNSFRKILSSKSIGKVDEYSGENLFLTGLHGSLDSFILYHLYVSKKKLIYVTTDKEKIFRIRDDINVISGNDIATVYLNEYDDEYEDYVTSLSVILKEISAERFLILTSAASLNVRVSAMNFQESLIRIKKGQERNFSELVRSLSEIGFNRKKIVEEVNDFSVRGGIIDIYAENTSLPLRIEFLGDTIDSIREFDPVTQRSVSSFTEAEILPPEKLLLDDKGSDMLLNFLNDSVIFVIDEPDLVNTESQKVISSSKSKIYISAFTASKTESISEDEKRNLKEINLNSLPQPSFASNFKLCLNNLKELEAKLYEVTICCSDSQQKQRMKDLIEENEEIDLGAKIKYLDSSIHSGFILTEDKVAVYTEHEIFGRFFRSKRKGKIAKGISFRELNSVNYGDLMVHNKFGIGKYAGLKKIQVGGVEQEAVKLIYKDNDELFVNINSLHQLSKYSAQEGVQPSLSKLGTAQWDRIKNRARKKLKEIAGELIKLYAERRSSKGFSFSPDSLWQKELEASFIYEDTPDQRKAWDDVRKDMESPYPMDRLICGDVGFGKTEIAVRAAFKAVQDNKQVAVLVPTTILAEQHYNTFRDRLSQWAVEVEHLSRFKTQSEQRVILNKLEEGKINVIIGTHRLLSKDVKFKDLGLLVIDEEQRFGVTAKEKIKMLKKNIDVLTLTATPIPRTLNFSLLGARDFSVINTPPPNRQPIHTEIIGFDISRISEAIENEISRGGQVYFVNDKVKGLEELSEIVRRNVPSARPVIAHGQMEPAKLEKVMMRFLEKKTNVLVCTKIIESGLDIPSVNTIIINHAENFGLAELYQLRGRVGRSNIKSYAYLITPPGSSLTRQAVRRLHALEEFTELGSGLNLALRDLEIRGAGNLLGAEQSGFIAEMGFETYMQILDEALKELKGSEHSLALSMQTKKSSHIVNFTLESDIPMLIPESYVQDENIRLEMYQRLSKSLNTEEIDSIRDEMKDRFGLLPQELESLITHVMMKIKLIKCGFKKMNISRGIMTLTFNEENDEIFSNGYFQELINFLNNNRKDKFRLKQDKKYLTLEIELSNDCIYEKLNESNILVEEFYKLRKTVD